MTAGAAAGGDPPRDENSLFALDQLIGAYLHQDMELVAPTVPAAIARYARLNDPATKAELLAATAAFRARFGNDLHGAFAERYRFDFMPEDLGLDVPGFFAMVEAILADPGCAGRYERPSLAGVDPGGE